MYSDNFLCVATLPPPPPLCKYYQQIRFDKFELFGNEKDSELGTGVGAGVGTGISSGDGTGVSNGLEAADDTRVGIEIRISTVALTEVGAGVRICTGF